MTKELWPGDDKTALAGRWQNSFGRATTNQVLHGLRAGYWPTDLEAARGSHRHFRPIAVYPEFRATPGAHAPAAPAPVVETRSRATYWQMLVSTGFQVTRVEALGLLTPPPHMLAFAERHQTLVGRLAAAEARVARWPILRRFGDHFLVVARRRD